MAHKESLDPSAWFGIGDKDLKRARLLLGADDLEGAGFNLQQAVEKYLKGYLLSRGWKLKRIHDLDVLVRYAIQYDPSFAGFKPSCQKITQYYFEDRYPEMMPPELDKKDLVESLRAAEEIIAKIKTLVK